MRYDGESAEGLAARLDVPRVVLFDAVGSTLDEAHRLAPSAASGTLVLADAQTAGRGRHGRRWSSRAGAGVWMTLIERSPDPRAIDVLSLRCGLYAAEALDALTTSAVGVKWPNDLYIGGGKLAGILIESRWRDAAPDWVAIGFGLNVRSPDVEGATGLTPDVSRLDALAAVVPALRRAAVTKGRLTIDELARWRRRDIAGDRPVTAPAVGRVEGIDGDGQLLVAAWDGTVTCHRSGSLTFADQPACS